MMKRAQSCADERRNQAEARLAAREPRRAQARRANDEAARLLHELRVHQIELEMQNEELRAARGQTEAVLQRYTALFDFAPVGYVVLDAAGTILEANLELARMIGIPRRRLGGWTFAKYVDHWHHGPLREFLRTALLEESSEESRAVLEVSLRRHEAESLPVRLVASAHAGARPSLLVAILDVTASRQAAVAREESTHKDEFLAALSHELRNPLFPVCTSAAVLQRAEPGSTQARKAIATIERQVGHLVHIVDDLLDVTRIARGKVNLRREPLELARLVNQAIEDHRPEFQDQHIALESHLDPQPIWVDADGTRIVQVIGNLLVNALKFTSAAGRVDVGLRREGSHAVLSVRDNGVGIPADVRDRLFVPFIQAPQTLDRTRGGLGLGLAMVKGLVELHGGAVEVASDGPDRGSEFTVRLPLVEPPEEVAEPERVPRSASRRVLVIEDNPDAADAMRELLAYDGHDARVAYDGREGLALAREFRPEFVFCDIGLPGMDGFEVARAIRAEPALADTYLVALSGYALPEDRKRSAEAGFDCHLAKPPSVEQVERVLAERPAFGAVRG
jgi:PAS domain S-box-containing protein